VLLTVASRGEGLDELAAAVARHHAFLQTERRLEERRLGRARNEVTAILRDRLWQQAAPPARRRACPAWAERVAAGQETPYTAARALLAAFLEDKA
jgi:LAO/AO transport system kinase